MLINVFFQLPSSGTIFNMLNLEITLFPQSFGKVYLKVKKLVFRFLNNMHYMVRVNLAKGHYSIARLCFFNPSLRNLVSLNMLSMSC